MNRCEIGEGVIGLLSVESHVVFVDPSLGQVVFPNFTDQF